MVVVGEELWGNGGATYADFEVGRSVEVSWSLRVSRDGQDQGRQGGDLVRYVGFAANPFSATTSTQCNGTTRFALSGHTV